ncbi:MULTISPECIES: class I SAM-dependent methyltransferase [unclassified Frankia]|uniref:class I SAM-dependent methyltransferase n=1 Tax=unclassified Frankia TaxID=2632575 RepID=UPI0006DC3DAC|nr:MULTISPECIES: class I SAM-dependent methyltransferase [unclassified Frankia]KQC37771.1 methyltransferase [Frankia sp. ACN1ag]
MDATDHDATVRRSFTRQTGLFTGDDALFAERRTAPLPWLEPLDPTMIVLDVACGAGHVAEAAAPRVRQVVGVDLTAALLGLAAERLRAAGIANVLLQHGHAAELPFLDGSFDVVVCRAALHHFADPAVAVAEMARVCRHGGRVVVADLVAPDARLRGPFDELHRTIDPSHAGVLLADELAALLRAAVGPLGRHDTETTAPFAVAEMLTDAGDRDGALAVLAAELDGGPATGFAPRRVDGQIHVQFPATTVVATRREQEPG